MSLLQHLFLLASACVQVQHVPDVNVTHQPRADVTFSQSFSASDMVFQMPIEVDVLRGKQVGGHPLLGETIITVATLKGADITLTAPGRPPVNLSAACPPRLATKRR